MCLRLNRTSVGLKPAKTTSKRMNPYWPQSNQRGIETVQGQRIRGSQADASIEPAWD